jgi:hypothetical protein
MTINETEYPVLQTVNSKYFDKVWCDVDAGWIKMKFNSWGAYIHAWNNWHDVSRPKWGDYVIITPEASCKNYNATQQRHFIRAVDEKRDNATMTITCKTEAVSFADMVGPERPVEVEFENFNQGDVSVQAEEAAPNGNFEDRGGEVLKDPSGDSDFDVYLDAKIGKMDLAALNNSTWAQFNITLEDFYGESDLPDLVTNNLAKRAIGDRIKKAVKKVSTATVHLLEAFCLPIWRSVMLSSRPSRLWSTSLRRSAKPWSMSPRRLATQSPTSLPSTATSTAT